MEVAELYRFLDCGFIEHRQYLNSPESNDI